VQSDSQPKPKPKRTFIKDARRAQIVAAAVDTIAEDGYANASLARIAARLGISKGVISYHFAGKDDLVTEILRQVVEQARDYMVPRITAQSTGAGTLRAYIESNLAFIRDNPRHLIAVVEVVRNTRTAERRHPFRDIGDADGAVRAVTELLTRFQETGEFRRDFDPAAMAIAIRAAIDAVPGRLTFDLELDIDSYAQNIATVFELATRA